MSLLATIRRRTLALAAALAVVGIGVTAAPATAGPFDPYPGPTPCFLSPGICLYETGYNQGFTAWGVTDIGSTPYYYSIWNYTTKTRLALCGGGTSCTSGQYGYPSLHQCYSYVAYLGSSSATLPLPVVAKKSAFMTLCR
jgi:hypothetical protein